MYKANASMVDDPEMGTQNSQVESASVSKGNATGNPNSGNILTKQDPSIRVVQLDDDDESEDEDNKLGNIIKKDNAKE